MKAFSLGMLSAASFLAVSCETMNQPITSGSFDPLTIPGGGVNNDIPTIGPDLSPGTFVSATIPNTAFYNNKPKGGEDADKLLDQGTNMKIVSAESDFVKVELDSGEVGWIPSVMISSAMTPQVPIPTGNIHQVYPPLPETGPIKPLPPLDPAGLPPEGAIPAIIDPDAPLLPPSEPITIDPVPDITTPTPDADEEGDEVKASEEQDAGDSAAE